MSTIKLSKSEATDLIDGGELASTTPWKYGTVESYVVIINDNHYMIKVPVHTNEGWQLDSSVTATKVRKVTKTITEWIVDNE